MVLTFIVRTPTPGQYSHFSSFEPFHRKTAWVKSLFNNQIETIKSFMSWNGYPNGVRNFLIKKFKTKYIDSSTSDAVNHDTDDDMLPKIWIRIPYLGNRGDFLLKSCLNKIQRFLSKPVKFITIYDTKNSLILFPTKINFLLYLVVILYTRSLALVVAKPILA
jgi:hypothetical protein